MPAFTFTTPDDFLLLLSRFHYLSIQQIVRLLGKETSSNHIRSKLKQLVDSGLVEVTAFPRASATGKMPFLYSLTKKGQRVLSLADSGTKSQKSGIALEHTLSINDVAILSYVLPKIEPRITLFELRHEVC
jgi:predicted ArsR family transcriptional regulator